MDLRIRWGLAGSIVLIAVVSAISLGRAPAMRAADPPWDPPPCGAEAPAVAGHGAWFRLDPDLDGKGWLVGQRLTIGSLDGDVRHRIDLAPESFASGPVGDLVLVGSDDERASRLQVVDPVRGCATDLATESAVIRSAILGPDARSVLEHRVNRTTREDEGIWQRPRDGQPARRVLAGLPPDPAFGPTFSTDLRLTPDGALLVASCGEARCRVRVLATDTGSVHSVQPTGPVLGATSDEVITYGICPGLPCEIVATALSDGHRRVVLPAAGLAAMPADGSPEVIFETSAGEIATLDLATNAIRADRAPAGTAPVRGGSTATSGASVQRGVLLAPMGHLTAPREAYVLGATDNAATSLPEVQP